MADEPGGKTHLIVALIGVAGALGAALIARGGGNDKPPPAPVIQVVQNNQQVQQVQQVQVAQQQVLALAAEPAPAPRRELAGVKTCWRIEQIQEVGTHIQGELMLVRAGDAAEGLAKFDGHPLASVAAAFEGSRLRMVLTYPNGVVGEYAGTLDGRDGNLVQGVAGANTGASARWSGTVTACR